ncbi:hypothetical protein BH10BAC2_BH10BAC2_37010 [soil metagenome]
MIVAKTKQKRCRVMILGKKKLHFFFVHVLLKTGLILNGFKSFEIGQLYVYEFKIKNDIDLVNKII